MTRGMRRRRTTDPPFPLDVAASPNPLLSSEERWDAEGEAEGEAGVRQREIGATWKALVPGDMEEKRGEPNPEGERPRPAPTQRSIPMEGQAGRKPPAAAAGSRDPAAAAAATTY